MRYVMRSCFLRMRNSVVKRRVSVLLCLLLGFVQVATGAGLKTRIDAIIKSRPKVAFSIEIVKADSGRTVYAHQAHRPLIPASNMKIVTSATALHYLGPGFVYVTKVGLVGDTVVVIGSGDPLLGDRDLDALNDRVPDWIMTDIVEKLRQAGRNRVQDIVIDSTVFDDDRIHPSWPTSELNRAYSAEVCGLNYSGNSINMTVRNTDGRIVIDIDPQTEFVKLSNQVSSVKPGDPGVGALRKAGSPNDLIVRGICRKQQGPFGVAIEQPAVFFGYLLAERLGAGGIAVGGQLVERALGPDVRFQLVSEYRTPLSACLQRCNKDSFNLAAEALLKTVAAHGAASPAQGSWAQGQRKVRAYLKKLGVSETEFQIDDGSGLSRDNQLSAHTITTVLRSIRRSRHWDFYSQSLAICGVDGTLAKDFKEAEYQGRIIGKSGYLTGVRAFSGVVRTDNGEYIFSILANKAYGVKQVVYNMAKAIIDCQ